MVRGFSLLLAAFLLVVGGCNDTHRQAAKTSPPPQRPSPLRSVDWANVTIPGSVCGFRRPIHLRHRHAFVQAIPPRYASDLSNQRAIGLRRGVYVYGGWAAPRYGELAGQQAAALSVYCSNGGGTADGNFAYAWVIFTMRDGRLAPIGIVTPRVKALPRELATVVRVRFDRGSIAAREFWFGPRDGTCCPSGRARTTWSYDRGALRAAPTVVVRRPA